MRCGEGYMAIQTIRDDVRRRVTVTMESAISASDVTAFIASEAPVPGGDQPYDILVDLRFAQIGLGTSGQAQSLAAAAERQQPNRRRGRVAVVLADEAAFGVRRVLAL